MILHRALIVLIVAALCAGPSVAQTPKTFAAHVKEAEGYFKQQKYPEALAAIQEAGKLEPTNYRAPALAATIFVQGGQLDKGKQSINEALRLVPPDGKASLEKLATAIDDEIAKQAATAKTTAEPAGSESGTLTGATRRKYDTLLVVVEEADQAKSQAERRKLLDELLFKTGEFAREFPNMLPVWTLRTAAALELETEIMAMEAGSEMIRLGAENSSDPKVRQLLAKLDRKGWLKTPQQIPEAKAAAQKRWQDMLERGGDNSLGMRFVPVPGTKLLFSVWETRKKDYEAYSRFSFRVDNSWQNVTRNGVAVSEGPDHPVVMVSWNDARGFCEWLTQKEQSEGRIPTGYFYRLPTDPEWSAAVGLTGESGGAPKDRDEQKKGVYPWGTQWPPPNSAGNYADLSFWARFTDRAIIEGYQDGFATTAPVGSFAANRFGLFDLGGNVWEWCEDFYDGAGGDRLARGESWNGSDSGVASSSNRFNRTPDTRWPNIGFRVVLEGSAR